jgi:hypothetical protein
MGTGLPKFIPTQGDNKIPKWSYIFSKNLIAFTFQAELTIYSRTIRLVMSEALKGYRKPVHML